MVRNKIAVLIRIFSLLIMLLCLPSVCFAYKLKESYQYYNISGRDPQRLLEQMNIRDAGIGHFYSGNRIVALTYYNINMSHQLKMKEDNCDLLSFELILDVKQTYPRWVDEKNGSPQLKRKWSKFYSRIVEHEEIHKKYAKEQAAETERRMQQFASRGTRDCDEFQEAGQKIIDRVAKEFRQKHVNFDKAEAKRTEYVRDFLK